MSHQLEKEMENSKVIAILRGVEGEDLLPAVEALYQGGIKLLEITFPQNEPGQFTDIAKQIEMLRTRYDNKMYIGAGTVTTAELVELTASAGGQFIVSPDAQQDVIGKTKELGLVSMPGAMTPTEILSAHKWGADYVKVFPAASLGVAYLKAIRSPISHVKLLAVGGIGSHNAREYLNAGVVGIGVGGELVDKKIIAAKEYDKLTVKAQELLAAVKG